MKRHLSPDAMRARKARVREREGRRRSLQGKHWGNPYRDLKSRRSRQAAVASVKGARDGSKIARLDRIAEARPRSMLILISELFGWKKN